MGRRAKRTAPKFYFVVMIFQGKRRKEEEGGGTFISLKRLQFHCAFFI
jgi:hypothetical protein